MRFAFVLLLLFSIALSRDYYAMEINELEPEDLNEFLSDDSDRFLVLSFRGEQCLTCKWQLYYPNLLTYFFEGENDIIFAAIDTNKAGRVAEFCDVDPESAKLELRILTKGGARCEQYLESESITDFVTSVTGRIAKKSYVTPHNRPTFEALRADKSKSHFIEIMSPFERPCYDFSIQVEKAAEAFAMEPSVDFNRVDCSLMRDLCEELQVHGVPAVMFFPAENVPYNQTYPEYPTVNGIVSFLNGVLGTHRSPDGALDELYGRDAALDALAERFATATEAERRAMMKQVKRERKQHLNSALYYAAMKDILANGTDIVFDRVNATAFEVQFVGVMDPRHAQLMARLNVYRAFEPIEPTRSIILTPQNVDRVLNGHRNVMVLFFDPRCPDCRNFAQVYRDAFDKHPFTVFFASLNAAHFEELRIRFNVTDHPVLKYFAEDAPLEDALDIPERTAEGIVDWLRAQLAEQTRRKKEREMKMAMEETEKEEAEKEEQEL